MPNTTTQLSFQLRSFTDLTPTEFENFIFDILSSCEVRNLTWRTPGADGGRDMEGEVFTNDFSGFSKRERWYFECKRYSSSLDWPLVYAKIAHADTNNADFLLVITNSTPSPTCETQISKWNEDRRTPMIRVWRGYELESIANELPAVAAKYGLRRPPEPIVGEFLNIALEISKISQAAYAATIVGADPIPAIEASSALSELFSIRAKNIAEQGYFVPLPLYDQNQPYPWAQVAQSLVISDIALRAILSVFRFVTKSSHIMVEKDGAYYIAKADSTRHFKPNNASHRLTALLATWSDTELQLQDDNTLRIRTR